MPTIPPEQSPSAEPQAHQARAIAESFGVDAARYDRSRPRYPAELIASVVAAGRGRDVLDVGIGTGIVARQFQAAGCTVLGVEPDSRMAEFARRTGAEVEVATFENWDPAGRAFATTRLPQTALNEVRTELGAVIDRSGGNFVCHSTTVMLTATKKS